MSLYTKRRKKPRMRVKNEISKLRKAAVKNTGSPESIIERYENYVFRCYSHPHEGQFARGTDNIEKLHEELHTIATNPVMLAAAYYHCRQFGGRTAGPDGLQYSDYPTNKEPMLLWRLFNSLSKSLRSGTFCVGEMRKAKIPKIGRPGSRTLTIANLTTRWVDRAVMSTIRPLLERQFLDYSIGGRPTFSLSDAFQVAKHALESQHRGIWLIFDIKNAFDVIPHAELFNVLRKTLRNSSICDLVRSLSANPGVNRGIRQGSAISPTLLNLYCHHFFDRWWHKTFTKIPMIRFVDDIAVFCSSIGEANSVYTAARDKLLAAGLPIKESLEEALFNLENSANADWLGVTCRAVDGTLKLQLADTAWQRLRAKVCDANANGKTEEQIPDIIAGWTASFAHAISQNEFAPVVERIVRMTMRYSSPA